MNVLCDLVILVDDNEGDEDDLDLLDQYRTTLGDGVDDDDNDDAIVSISQNQMCKNLPARLKFDRYFYQATNAFFRINRM